MSLIDNSFLTNEFRNNEVMPYGTITIRFKQRHLG